MSKLIDNLRRVFRNSPTPMGFRSASTPLPTPALLLGYLPQANKEIVDSIGNSSLDGIIVDMGAKGISAQDLGKLSKSFGSIPWGILWVDSKFEDGDSLVKAGADFIIANITTTPAAVLQEKQLGHILAIEPEISDSMARAIDYLGVEAVFLQNGLNDRPVLNISQLLVCQRISSFLRKPMLASVSPELTPADLQSLISVGIKGLVVKLTDKKVFTRIPELKKILGTLSAPKGGVGDVTIPRINPEKPQPEEDEEPS